MAAPAVALQATPRRGGRSPIAVAFLVLPFLVLPALAQAQERKTLEECTR